MRASQESILARFDSFVFKLHEIIIDICSFIVSRVLTYFKCFSGKTTLLSVLAHGEAVETVPTIGLNVKVFQKGKVNMKCWDIGGQAQYRSEWSRYAKGCDVVLYVVDAAAPQKMATAKKELHKLLDDGSIGSTPLLVLANKIDIQPHVGETELIERLQLNYVMDTPWMVLPISALHCTNIEQVVEWLTSQGK